MNIYHLKEKAIQLADELDEVSGQLKNTIEELQTKCAHPYESIVESPYKSGTFYDQEELRLCSVCGLQETRPCTGWQHLVNSTGEYGRGEELRKVSRDKLYDIRHDVLRGTCVGISDKEHLGEQE